MTSHPKSHKLQRFPTWMRRPVPPPGRSEQVSDLLAELNLNTVCCSAQCPNHAECFARGTATFMILGNTCTRDCRFCAVPHGRPVAPSPDEPDNVAKAASTLDLRHVVVTSVTRDDLPHGGAEQFAETIRSIRRHLADATVEVLTPDFQGIREAVDIVLDAQPDVFNHNVETIERLYRLVRPQAEYARSLSVLEQAAGRGNGTYAKSGIMVGLGESDNEVQAVLTDLRSAGTEILTIGQYLAPSSKHAPIDRFVTPDQYSRWKELAMEMGFLAVAAGPYVRSSYKAGQLLAQARR